MRREFPRNSLAGIVLEPHEPRAAKNIRRRSLSRDSLGEIVLGAGSSQGRRLLATSLAIAAALHGGAGFAAIAAKNGGSGAAPARAKRTLVLEHLVALDVPSPPPLPAVGAPASTQDRAVSRVRASVRPSAALESSPPPKAAQAGPLATAEASASDAVDFTGFATGNAPVFVGGLTARAGTSELAVHGQAAAARAGSPPRPPSRARAVGRPSLDWDCPWPAGAAALSIREQHVVLRARVRADGTVASAELLSDPGHGFGPVALACVQKQRFPSALDETGEPVAGSSPPIRVRFTRP